jgi:gamma-glutamyl phosphate reductase
MSGLTDLLKRALTKVAEEPVQQPVELPIEQQEMQAFPPEVMSILENATEADWKNIYSDDEESPW